LLNIILTKTKTYLIRFIQTQLAITLISLPILVGWGLGFSYMAAVGNLIFAPLLTGFLMLSSLLLLTQIMGIPNGLIATALNKLSHAWNVMLGLGQPAWILEAAKPPTWILIAMAVVTWVVLHHRSVRTPLKRTVAMVGLLVIFYSIFALQRCYNNDTQTVLKFNDKLYVIKLRDSDGIILIDDGYFAKKQSIEKAIDYELKPWIIKHYGHVRLAEVRLKSPGKRSFKAVMHLGSVWKLGEVFY
jgi:hypothetical protein